MIAGVRVPAPGCGLGLARLASVATAGEAEASPRRPPDSERALPRSLEVLHERSFARYLAAVTVSTLGSGMATVALAFAVLGFGSATDLGVVLLAREIPIVVFLLLGGVFADRLPRRTILVGCDLVKGAAQVATAILLFSGTANVWNVALLQGVFGVAAAFSRPATTGLVKETVSDARLQEANALLGAVAQRLLDRRPRDRGVDRRRRQPGLGDRDRLGHLLRLGCFDRLDAPRDDGAMVSRRSSAICATAGGSSSSARGR